MTPPSGTPCLITIEQFGPKGISTVSSSSISCHNNNAPPWMPAFLLSNASKTSRHVFGKACTKSPKTTNSGRPSWIAVAISSCKTKWGQTRHERIRSDQQQVRRIRRVECALQVRPPGVIPSEHEPTDGGSFLYRR